MFSCKIYKINPTFRKDFTKLLEDSGSNKGIKYSDVKVDGKKVPLFISIKHNNQIRANANKIGDIYKVSMDYNYQILDKDEKTHNIVLQNQFEMCILDSKEISDFVLVFASRGNADSFIDKLDQLVKKEDCISPIVFKLSENESKLRHEFPDIKLFHIENIQDSFVHSTRAIGDKLGLSNEYAKYTRLGGVIKSLMINYNGLFVVISSDGVVWSHRKSENEKLLVYDIIKKLSGHKVIQYQSKLNNP